MPLEHQKSGRTAVSRGSTSSKLGNAKTSKSNTPSAKAIAPIQRSVTSDGQRAAPSNADRRAPMSRFMRKTEHYATSSRTSSLSSIPPPAPRFKSSFKRREAPHRPSMISSDTSSASNSQSEAVAQATASRIMTIEKAETSATNSKNGTAPLARYNIGPLQSGNRKRKHTADSPKAAAESWKAVPAPLIIKLKLKPREDNIHKKVETWLGSIKDRDRSTDTLGAVQPPMERSAGQPSLSTGLSAGTMLPNRKLGGDVSNSTDTESQATPIKKPKRKVSFSTSTSREGRLPHEKRTKRGKLASDEKKADGSEQSFKPAPHGRDRRLSRRLHHTTSQNDEK